MYNKKFMELAIAEARDGIKNGHGGPFGAVVVKDGEDVSGGDFVGVRSCRMGFWRSKSGGNVWSCLENMIV